MPADSPKLTNIEAKAEPEPRELLQTPGMVCEQEAGAAELAFQLACEDPTEENHLASATSRARARMKAAAAELVRAVVALVLAWIARLLLDRSYRKVTGHRGVVGRTERAVLALERLMNGFLFGKVLGQRSLLRMLGGIRRTGDDGKAAYSLKLAERRYRLGDSTHGPDHATAADSPTVRVLIGVKLAANGEPIWCVLRFVSTPTGGWRRIYSGHQLDAQSILMDFYREPNLTGPSATTADEAEVAAELDVAA